MTLLVLQKKVKSRIDEVNAVEVIILAIISKAITCYYCMWLNQNKQH